MAVAPAPLRSDLRAVATGYDEILAALDRRFVGDRSDFRALHQWCGESARRARVLLPALRDRVARVRSTVDALLAERESLSRRIETMRAEASADEQRAAQALAAARAEADRRYRTLDEAHKAVVGRLTQLALDAAALRRDLDARGADIVRLKAQRDEVATRLVAADAEVARLRRDLDARRAEVDVLQGQRVEAQARATTAEAEVTRLRREVAEARALLGDDAARAWLRSEQAIEGDELRAALAAEQMRSADLAAELAGARVSAPVVASDGGPGVIAGVVAGLVGFGLGRVTKGGR